MAPASKRTRQSAESENPPTPPSSSQGSSTPSTSDRSMPPPTPSSRPTTRRALQSTSSLSDLSAAHANANGRAQMTPPDTPSGSSTSSASPSRPSASPSRPILTRSATTRAPGTSLLTRASTMFTPSRRDNAHGSLASPIAGPSTLGSSAYANTHATIGLGTPSERVTRSGLLVRTQSSPALASPGAYKAGVAAGGGGGSAGKGGPEDVFGTLGGRRWGKGKENIPPKKEDEENANQRNKRLRVTSGPRSVSSRGRSGSVASVRSESSSSASSFYSCGPNLLSPSPSPSTPASSRSSVDPFDAFAEDINGTDVERTPTKARPQGGRDARVLPTPPASSSPFMAATNSARTGTSKASRADIDATRRRMSLVKMASTSSVDTMGSLSSSDADVLMDGDGSDTETEIDSPPSPSRALFKPRNPYKHLKGLLRLSATADKASSAGIIGRDEEKDALKSYFSSRSDRDVGLYVSGPPGTGKTALVSAMGKEVARDGWNVVEVGCMGLGVSDVWRRLGQAVGCAGSEAEVGRYMAQSGRDTLIILDEIDSLLPAPPALPTAATAHLLSKLFSFPLLSSAKRTVKLIAISNTLDLTVRANLVLPSGAQPVVLPFKAYGASDMARIVSARLENVTAAEDAVKVDTKAVELLTRKVEAQNGDLRMCLATLGMAVGLAEADWVKKGGNAASASPVLAPAMSASGAPLIKVSLPHVIKAFTSHTQQLKAAAGSVSSVPASAFAGQGAGESAIACKVRSVPLQGRMVLVSILIHLSRSRAGLPGIPAAPGSASGSASGPSPSSTPHRHGDLTTSTLYATYSAVMSHESSPFPPAAESDYRDLLSNLETLGLVSIVGFGSFGFGFGTPRSGSAGNRSKNGHAGTGGAPRVELCVREDEVRAALSLSSDVSAEGGGASGKGRADEEVGKVWDREEAKVVRQREKIARAAEALKAVAAEEQRQ